MQNLNRRKNKRNSIKSEKASQREKEQQNILERYPFKANLPLLRPEGPSEELMKTIAYNNPHVNVLCSELESTVHIKQKADRSTLVHKLSTLQSLDNLDIEESQLLKDVANIFGKFESEESRAKREWEAVLNKICRNTLQLLEKPEIKILPGLGVFSTYIC